MRIGITGSSGFIGSELVTFFLSKNHEVFLLQRTTPTSLALNATYIHFDMEEAELPDISMLDVLIHTAFIPYQKTNSSPLNIAGTLALSNACKAANIQLVFLSSMSAHAGALSQYGKHKFELEKQLDSSATLILKLGLVIGSKGLFSRLNSTVKKVPFIPLIGGGNQPIQIISIGDVAKVIEHCITRNVTGIYNLATPQIYTMLQLFKTIANHAGKNPIFIPIPYFIADLGISVVQFLHLPFPVSKENLFGLKQLTSIDTNADLQALHSKLLDLEQSIAVLEK